MRFEGRDLTTYATPVAVEAFEVGTTYFSVSYLDRDRLVPTLEPLVFIGRDLEPGDVSRLYFQDPESFRLGVVFSSGDTEAEADAADDEPGGWREHAPHATFYSTLQSDATNMFEYEEALNELLKCSLRRSAIARQTGGSLR